MSAADNVQDHQRLRDWALVELSVMARWPPLLVMAKAQPDNTYEPQRLAADAMIRNNFDDKAAWKWMLEVYDL